MTKIDYWFSKSFNELVQNVIWQPSPIANAGYASVQILGNVRLGHHCVNSLLAAQSFFCSTGLGRNFEKWITGFRTKFFGIVDFGRQNFKTFFQNKFWRYFFRRCRRKKHSVWYSAIKYIHGEIWGIVWNLILLWPSLL